MEIDRDAADVERDAEGVVVGEVGGDDEARGLGVEEGEVGVADVGGGGVGHLRARVGAADAGEGREGDVLLEPDEGGRDRRAQVRARVDYDCDVRGVERGGAAEGGGVGGDWRGEGRVSGGFEVGGKGRMVRADLCTGGFRRLLRRRCRR